MVVRIGPEGGRYWSAVMSEVLGLRPMGECPRCGSPRTVPLVYGIPGPEMLQALGMGLVRLGATQGVGSPPDMSCVGCGADIWDDGTWASPVPDDAVTPELLRRAVRSIREIGRPGEDDDDEEGSIVRIEYLPAAQTSAGGSGS
jgi:hypothetical protein